MKSRTGSAPPANARHTPGSLFVRVLDIDRQPIHGATVQLRGETLGPQELRWDEATDLDHVEAGLRGRFLLSVFATGLEGQERRVTLPHPSPVEFVLGKEGLPFYYRGTVKTPFRRPEPDLIAVTLNESADAELWVGQVEVDPGLVPVATHEQIRRNNVRVFRPPALSVADSRALVDQLRGFEHVRLFGPVLEMFEKRLVYLTHQFIVKFKAGVTPQRAERIVREHEFRVVRPIAAAANAYLIEGEPRLDYGLLDAANDLADADEVEYAEPNAVMTSILYAVEPKDFLFLQGHQWYVPHIGLPDAWQILRKSNANGVTPGMPGDRTFGDAEVQIAVFDSGVESTTIDGVVRARHPEFRGSVTSGAAKVAAFYDAVNMRPNNDKVGGDHGTACAGVAAALTDNPAHAQDEMEGIAGAAGNCRIVAIRAPVGLTNLRWADAFVWLAGFAPGWIVDGTTYCAGTVFPPPLARGVDIHSISLQVPDAGLMNDAFDFLATYGRGGRGILSFLAAGNTAAPLSHPENNTIADHEKVIAVAASIHVDVRARDSCYDQAIGLCAPSSGDRLQYLQMGAPRVVTTDTVGTGHLPGHTGGTLDYLQDFGGTSAATPLAAGVAALMLSIKPELNWVQLRELLRNTAVKIDKSNKHPIGKWSFDAFGNPLCSPWYGYGRVNAAAAVAAAAKFAWASKVVIRDNLSDTGDVPSSGWHADSPDIWVRRTDGPVPMLAYGAPPPHENPLYGQDNYVYLRVKNVGKAGTHAVYLRVLVCHFPGFEFCYPDHWRPSTSPSSPLPSPLVPGSYLIGEERIDDLAAGADIIVKLRWDQNLVPPTSVTVGGIPVTWQPCLLAEVSPHDGPGPSGGWPDVRRYNNLAQKTVVVDESGHSGPSSAFAVVAGSSQEGVKSLIVDRTELTPGAQVFLRIDYADVIERWLELIRAGAEEASPALPWRDRTSSRSARGKGRGARTPVVCQECIHGQDVILFSGGADTLELPLFLATGEYVALAIGVIRLGSDAFGVLRITQRLSNGEVSSGYEFRS